MTIERQPINITVNRIASRIAGVDQPGGYQIINRDLTATVWVASNPSVADNAGTPISPGTSLRWNNNLDIYLILGSDAESLTVTTAQIVVAYDNQDWDPAPAAVAAAILNSGVLIVDKPIVVFNSTLAANTSTPLIPISKYSTVLLKSLYQVVAANDGTMTINWYDSNQLLISKFVITHSGTAALVFPSAWDAAIPAIGSYVEVEFTGVITASLDLKLVLSNRQTQRLNQYLNGPNLGSPDTLAYASFGIATGTLVQITSNPWYGEVDVAAVGFTPGAAAVAMESSSGGAIRRSMNVQVPVAFTGVNRFDISRRLMLWGTYLSVAFYNQSGGLATGTLSVIPVRQNP